jgi:hypothetical protein
LEVFSYNDPNNKYNDIVVSDNDLLELLKVLEAFIIRRLICNVPTNALNKIFMSIGREIKQYDPCYKTEYINTFEYILSHYNGTQKFPTDTEIRDKMVTRDFYNMQAKNKIHIFERLENYNNDGIVNGLEKLTFEHIMPQILSDDWKKELGPSFKQVHEKYIHTIGNLTFITHNSELGQKLFSEKKTIDGGFNASHLWLNNFIKKQESWDEDTIKERAKQLIERGINIWQYCDARTPSSTRISKPINLEFGLDDEIDVTGYKLISFKLGASLKMRVDSWLEFYLKAAEDLYTKDYERFEELLKNNDLIAGYMGDLTEAKKELIQPEKIADNVYLEGNFSAKDIIKNTRRLYDKLGYNVDNIRVFVQIKS